MIGVEHDAAKATLVNPRTLGRSLLALLAGILAVVVLSIGTDLFFRAIGVFPPADQPILDSSLLFLAFCYRTVYGALGGYIVSRLAPYAPMGHALASGVAGFVASLAGAIAGRSAGPSWYPIALVLTALPCAWLGGAIYRQRHGKTLE